MLAAIGDSNTLGWAGSDGPNWPEFLTDELQASGRRLTVVNAWTSGGTDGFKLSFMGMPTPNLSAGEHNCHSRLEWGWVSAQDMDKAVEVIVNVCRVWEERTGG